MKKKIKSIVLIGLIVVMIILSIKVIVDKRLKTVTVYTVNKKLKPHDKIEAKDLIERQIPVTLSGEEIYTNKKDIIDKYVKLEHHIYPNDILSKHNIIGRANTDDLMLELNENESLFSVEAGSLESLGGTLKKGHRVDVYSILYSQGRKEENSIGKNIRVIGVKDRKGLDVEKGKSSANTVLLAIKKELVNDFVKAQCNGKIIMVGRI